MHRARFILAAAVALALIGAAAMPSRGQDGRADVEYFEKHIRPLFSQHCAECHDGKKQKGGLRLDAPRFIRKGGDSGAIFVAGEPDKSDIIEAVRHTNPDFKMPPKKKLSGIEIAHMEKWVRSGAPMPEDDANVVEGPFDYENWRQFWSFKPLKKPDAPQVKNAKWVRNPIDAFIAAGQEAAGLAPAREADRHTLIRRATYDLLGLPPTPAEIDAFVNDTSPDAYEKLIRRLLASPYYGEKYGRHWLDVARYEQGRVKVPGVKNTRGELDYRDYVVRAFNQDKRYDRFIMEQLAGDLLPPAKEKQDYFDQLIATAYLSIGNWFDECTDPNRLRLDMIDEQLNATGKAFLGLTLSCARCHDHKHDPITTEDYYALAGIFRSTRIVDEFSEEWRDGRVRLTRELMTREQEDLAAANAAEIAARRAEMTLRLALATANLHALWKQDHAAYVQAAKQVPALGATAFEAEAFAGQSDLKVTLLEQDGQRIEVLEAQKPIDQWVKYELNVPEQGRYVLEARYASGEPRPLDVQVGGTTVLKGVLAEDTFGVKPEHWRWQVIGELDLRQGVNTIRLSTPQKGDLFPSIDRFRWYPVNADRRQAIDRIAKERSLDAARLARYADYPEEPFPSGVAIIPFVDEETRQQIAQAFAELGKLKAARPKAPLIITATDYRETFDLPVHVSGDTYRTRGEPVPRRTPTLFEHALKPPTMPADSSGRLELAQWIASPKNPLTARVMANRLWQWHFGKGLVETPNDFGSHGSPPTHPELLDWLASTFIEKEWSMKEMHFLIMTSATYRMGGRDEGTKGRRDEGELYDGFPRRRLSVEEIYDGMLATIGKLPRSHSEFDFNKSADRLMYVLTSNRSPRGLGVEIRKMFAVFDYDPTGEPIGRRDTSATAAQALFWLNNPIPQHFAREFAEDLLLLDVNDEARLEHAHLAAIGRPPEAEVKRFMLAFLREAKDQGITQQEAWTQVCLAIYRSNAFRYVD